MQEHKELHRLLGDIHQVIFHRRESVDRVAELFTTLRDQLHAHFIQEEDGGLFDQVPTRAPRLFERVKILEEQHPRFLEVIRELACWARENRSSKQWWDEIEQRFHQFRKNLMRHESEENDILQEAYGLDIGSQD